MLSSYQGSVYTKEKMNPHFNLETPFLMIYTYIMYIIRRD